MKRIRGNAEVKFTSGEQAEFPFRIDPKQNSRPVIFLYNPHNRKIRRSLELKFFSVHDTIYAKLEGKTNNNSHIAIDKLVLNHTGNITRNRRSPMKLTALSPIVMKTEDALFDRIEWTITNFLYTGSESTRYPSGAVHLDTISLSLENVEVRIVQLPEYEVQKRALEKKESTVEPTAKIVFIGDNLNPSNIREIADNICYLLSLSQRTLISPIIEERYHNDSKIYEHWTGARTEPFNKQNMLIYNFPGKHLKKYLFITYPHFKEYKKKLNLPAIFDYYLLTQSAPLLDVRCVLGYITLECLCDQTNKYFASQGDPLIPTNTKRVKKDIYKICGNKLTDEEINQLVTKLSSPNPSIPDSVSKIKKKFDIGTEPSDAKLYGWRKQFIHKGMFSDNMDKLQVYHSIVHFLDRILLSILGYKGNIYLDIENRYKERVLQ